MLTNNQWSSLSNHVRTKLNYYYDPAVQFVEQADLREQIKIKHKGVYIGFEDGDGKYSAREGFLKEDLLDIVGGFDQATDLMYTKFRKDGIAVSKLHTGTFYFTIITDVKYLPNPTSWDEARDGVYFMWGQNYRALYLPYEIQKMGLSKIDVLDRLCSFSAKIPANLWKFPEGLIFRLLSHSFSS